MTLLANALAERARKAPDSRLPFPPIPFEFANSFCIRDLLIFAGRSGASERARAEPDNRVLRQVRDRPIDT